MIKNGRSEVEVEVEVEVAEWTKQEVARYGSFDTT